MTTRLPSPRPAAREQSPRKRPACATAQCAGQGCRAVGDAGRGSQDGRSRRGQPAAPAASLRPLGPQLQGTVWAPRRTEAEPVREELQTAGGPGTVQTDPSPPRREAAVEAQDGSSGQSNDAGCRCRRGGRPARRPLQGAAGTQPPHRSGSHAVSAPRGLGDVRSAPQSPQRQVKGADHATLRTPVRIKRGLRSVALRGLSLPCPTPQE